MLPGSIDTFSIFLSLFALAWSSIVFATRSLTDWSDEDGFGVPTLDTEYYVTIFFYIGYAVPCSGLFFWINATYWEGGIKHNPLCAYPFKPLTGLLSGLFSYALITCLPCYLMYKMVDIDPLFYANIPCLYALLGLAVAILIYEPLGLFFFRCFGGGKKAGVEPEGAGVDRKIASRLLSGKKRRRSSISIGVIQDELELTKEEPELSSCVIVFITGLMGMAVAMLYPMWVSHISMPQSGTAKNSNNVASSLQGLPSDLQLGRWRRV